MPSPRLTTAARPIGCPPWLPPPDTDIRSELVPWNAALGVLSSTAIPVPVDALRQPFPLNSCASRPCGTGGCSKLSPKRRCACRPIGWWLYLQRQVVLKVSG